MNISIVGSGHVGLVTGACLADLGHSVVCVDNDHEKIEALKNEVVPFYEPGLKDLVRTNSREGRLKFTESIKEGARNARVIFIAVGTPSKSTGEADLSAIERVSREIAQNITSYTVIAEKSTVPVRTGEWVQKTVAENVRPGVEFDVASVPEFLREGSAIKDFKHPDRIVIGASSDRAAGILVKIFEALNAPILLTDIKSAELIKHCANAFLAMKISYINAVAHICELSGADIKKVAKGIGLDKRIGMDFLNPGVGFGGSCFPKDVSAFIAIAKQMGYDFNLLKEVENINEMAISQVIGKLRRALGDNLRGMTAAVLGLAFKPKTDDVRSAPAIKIINQLLELGVKVKAYDPVAISNARDKLGDKVEFCADAYEACEDADAMILVTEWLQFRHLDLPRIKKLLKRPVIIDGRNLYDPFRMKSLGFAYFGIGRGNSI